MAQVIQKIGFFAGSFDPIHHGHVMAAQRAAAQAGLERVYFIVEPRPRYKQGVKAHEHRIEMVRRAIEAMPLFGQIILNEPYCTINDTIPMLQSRFVDDELYMILGDDVASRLAQWSDVGTLAQSTSVIVLERSKTEQDIKRVFESIKNTTGVSIPYAYIGGDKNHLTSSELRKQLKSGSYQEGLHPAVLSYAREHGIYGSSGFGS